MTALFLLYLERRMTMEYHVTLKWNQLLSIKSDELISDIIDKLSSIHEKDAEITSFTAEIKYMIYGPLTEGE